MSAENVATVVIVVEIADLADLAEEVVGHAEEVTVIDIN